MEEYKLIQYGNRPFSGKEDVFYLPHSCDEWIIGNIEKAKEFLRELENKIKEVEAEKNK